MYKVNNSKTHALKFNIPSMHYPYMLYTQVIIIVSGIAWNEEDDR